MKKTKKKVSKYSHTVFIKVYLGVLIVSIVVLSTLGYVYFSSARQQLCANTISCINDLSGRYDEGATSGIFLGQTINLPKTVAQKAIATDTPVLGDTTTSNKRIYIDLTSQRLYAKEDDRVIYDFPVSTGKWYPTPTGDFRIWIKLRYTRMSGGTPGTGTYYNLPNVPYTMYFYNDVIPKARGYGIHGAYWHNNFGHPMSHGCVNMKEADVAQIYNWANPHIIGSTTYTTNDNMGTPITIYGVTPKS